MLIHFLLYCLSFFGIWFASGLVLSSVLRLAQSFKLPAFTFSFFVLGLLTSLPELAIGITSITNDEPEIFVGNLIGGVIIIFLLIIPLLGIGGNGLTMPKELSKKFLLFILLVTFTPALLSGDREINNYEGVLAIGVYLGLFIFFSREQSLLTKIKNKVIIKKKFDTHDLLKILLGVVILFVSSNTVVNNTLYFSELLHINSFFVSLIVVSLGTNIPEIALVFRALLQKKQDVALADYLGSASTNTLLFGTLTLLHPGLVFIPNHFFHRFVFIVIALVLFYIFAKSGGKLSRSECCILLCLYVTFIVIELWVIR